MTVQNRILVSNNNMTWYAWKMEIQQRSVNLSCKEWKNCALQLSRANYYAMKIILSATRGQGGIVKDGIVFYSLPNFLLNLSINELVLTSFGILLYRTVVLTFYYTVWFTRRLTKSCNSLHGMFDVTLWQAMRCPGLCRVQNTHKPHPLHFACENGLMTRVENCWRG